MRVRRGTFRRSSPAVLTNRAWTSWFLVKKRCGPTSNRLPSKFVVRDNPPTRSRRSRTTAFAPRPTASYAAASPDGPPPTMTRSFITDHLGRIACAPFKGPPFGRLGRYRGAGNACPKHQSIFRVTRRPSATPESECHGRT